MQQSAPLIPSSGVVRMSVRKMIRESGVRDRRGLMRHLETMSRKDMIRFQVRGDVVEYVLVTPTGR